MDLECSIGLYPSDNVLIFVGYHLKKKHGKRIHKTVRVGGDKVSRAHLIWDHRRRRYGLIDSICWVIIVYVTGFKSSIDVCSIGIA